jgi:hypothetical protein
MYDRVAYAKRLEDQYLKEASAAPPGVIVPEAFWYLHFKAFAFLTVGPDPAPAGCQEAAESCAPSRLKRGR